MSLKITEIWQEDEKTLCVEWADRKVHRFDVVQLRKNCPCAECQTSKKQESLEKIRPQEIHSVGNYALKIIYSDYHSSGIYTYEYLRKLGG